MSRLNLVLLIGTLTLVLFLVAVQFYPRQPAPPRARAAGWEGRREEMPSAREDRSPEGQGTVGGVLVEDGRVRDCVTGKVRSTGLKDTVRTTDLVSTGTVEDREASQKSFQQVFTGRVWGTDSSGKSASGILAAEQVITALHLITAELRLRLGLTRVKLLDIPCGDMMYMTRFLDTRTDIDYTGIDIVPELIARHRKEFAGKPWTFLHRDILKDGVEGKFDLIVNRQMLQHLKTGDVLAFLTKLSRSGSRYLLATSHREQATVSELNVNAHGRCRLLNLEAPPVALAAPLCYCRDGEPERMQALMLWRLPLQQVLGCTATRPMKVSNETGTKVWVPYYACGNWSV